VISLNTETRDVPGAKRARFRIRYLITALIVAVFLIFGAVALALLISSQNRLVQKSKNELIKTMCEDAYSTAKSFVPFLLPIFMQNASAPDPSNAAKYLRGELTDGQKAIDATLKKLVDDGLSGMKYLMVISKPDSTYTPGGIVLISSDESLVYKWKVPADVIDAITKGKKYIYSKNGIPELGIAKDGLIILQPLIDPGSTTKASNVIVSAKSIKSQVDDINAFVEREQRNTSLLFALVILGCLLIVILVTFFILSFLIRTRITEPIDKLAANAELVMEGDLDANIEIHEGGDFESLERAFKEMVTSIRMMLEKSMGDE
jgi:HAMP domain-containing protein